jgi:hypothetical protein
MIMQNSRHDSAKWLELNLRLPQGAQSRQKPVTDTKKALPQRCGRAFGRWRQVQSTVNCTSVDVRMAWL